MELGRGTKHKVDQMQLADLYAHLGCRMQMWKLAYHPSIPPVHGDPGGQKQSDQKPVGLMMEGQVVSDAAKADE